MASRPFVSASRRTDLPAWYSEWLISRFRAGYCTVHNPFRPSQTWRVDLSAEQVQAVFFWTRDPLPLLPHLDEIHKLGHRTIFQFTVTPYPHELEPGLRPVKDRLKTFLRLAERVGPKRVWWRYDPIILGRTWSAEWHVEQFTRLAENLAGATPRVTMSLVDFYRKTTRRLAPVVEGYGIRDDLRGGEEEVLDLVRRLAAIARANGITPLACCEPTWDDAGVGRAPCIDGPAAAEIFGQPVVSGRDPGQREHCLCAPAFDIGAPHTCLGGCLYCYATSSQARATALHQKHDAQDECLVKLVTTPEKDT